MQQKNLADIRHKLSIIYKHIRQKDMQYLKSYQKKKIKIPHLLSLYLFIFMLKKNRKTTKTCLWKIKPVLREKGLEIPRQKSSRLICFFCHHQIILADVS
jgi:hypothetical protein